MNNITNTSITLWRLREKYLPYELSDFTILTAERLVDKLYILARKEKLWWWPPLVNFDKGQIHLEWWNYKNKNRKYSIYVAEDQVSYIAVWGAYMGNEMEEGDINIENDLTEFWEWIAE